MGIKGMNFHAVGISLLHIFFKEKLRLLWQHA